MQRRARTASWLALMLGACASDPHHDDATTTGSTVVDASSTVSDASTPGSGDTSATTVASSSTTGDVDVPSGGPFTFLGPRDVGYWHAFVFDPNAPGTVYTGGDDATGVARSTDGGLTWSPLDALGVRSGWALDLGADGRLYVGDWYGTGIFVSQDGGETFAPGAGVEFPFSYIVSIAAHPTDPLVALAVAGFADGTTDGANGEGAPISTRGEVFRTNDGGASWEALGSPAEGALSDLAISPNDPEIVLVADGSSLWRSIDGGDAFALVTAEAGGNLVFSRTGNGVALAASETIWRSDDDGATWAPTDAPTAFYADVVASPTQDAFFAFGLTESGGALAQAIGTDGAIWEDVADPTYGGIHLGGAVDPANPEQVLVGTFGRGVVRYDVAAGSWTESSAGLLGAECDGVGVLSGTPARIVVACGNLGFAPYVALSDDDGLSWTMAEGPFVAGGLDVVMPIVADREDANVLVCAGDTIRRSVDRGETWTTVVEARSFGLAQGPDAAIYAGGVPFLRSVDHGATFEPFGDLACEAWQVAADPHQAGRVSAACPEDGFYATDDGTAWQRIALDAPAGHAYSALVFDPSASGHLAATLNQEGELGLSAQVMVSIDAGESWLDVTPDLECAFAPAILYLSDAAGHLVVGTQSADHYCPSIAGQLLESTDNGATWYDVTEDLWPPQVHVGGLFEGPDGNLFVSTWDGGMFRRDAP